MQESDSIASKHRIFNKLEHIFPNEINNRNDKKLKHFLDEIKESRNDFHKLQAYFERNGDLKSLIQNSNSYKFSHSRDLISQHGNRYNLGLVKELHAEIKIVQYQSQNNPEGLEKSLYLGLSKLYCAGYYSLIKAFEDIKNIEFNIPGTHLQPFR